MKPSVRNTEPLERRHHSAPPCGAESATHPFDRASPHHHRSLFGQPLAPVTTAQRRHVDLKSFVRCTTYFETLPLAGQLTLGFQWLNNDVRPQGYPANPMIPLSRVRVVIAGALDRSRGMEKPSTDPSPALRTFSPPPHAQRSVPRRRSPCRDRRTDARTAATCRPARGHR